MSTIHLSERMEDTGSILKAIRKLHAGTEQLKIT